MDSTQIKGTLVHPEIAGALFDFLGYLTSGDDPIIPGHVVPAVEALRTFAFIHNLSLDDADVLHWHDHIRA